MRLPISEHFLSVQGEGILAGIPSFFLRLSGCNLRCTWCDTPHASWEPDGTVQSIDELVAPIERHIASGGLVRHCVVTGGEPLIFAHLPALLARLRQLGMHITIETAGTVTLAGLGNGAPSPVATGAAARAEAPSPALVQLMSISPKLRNSTPWNDARDTDGTWAKRHEARRLNIPALASLLRGPWESQLKFVVSHERDLAEIEELLAALDGVLGGALRRVRGSPPGDSAAGSLDRSRVLLMPEGTHQAPPGSHAWLAKACIERGFRYCHRVHIDLFGHVRGT